VCGTLGEIGSAIKVVMVIMTSNGAPMGVTRRLGTGEKICIMLLSTEIGLICVCLGLVWCYIGVWQCGGCCICCIVCVMC